MDHRGSTRDITRTFCLQCQTYVDEQPRDLAEKKKETSKKVATSTNTQAEAIDKLVNSDHTLDPGELQMVLRNFGKKAMSIAKDTGGVKMSELVSVLHDVVIEVKDVDDTAFMAHGPSVEHQY